jgi:glutathione S-transferase
MTKPILTIGNRNYSSWSMRPWLALKWGGVDFDTRIIELGPDGGHRNERISPFSPTSLVPVLQVGDDIIWDSLSICEWAAEQNTNLLPKDAMARALCRSACAEMHSGFVPVRRDLSMNIRRRTEPRTLQPETAAQVARIDALWSQCLGRFGGPFLFGNKPTLADAMYAPVATRFRTYGIALSPPAQSWCDTIFADPAFKEWEAEAIAEEWVIEKTDAA